ncbi:hypothetical protein Ancab_023810 [Ancistrocladus abbreviatus]
MIKVRLDFNKEISSLSMKNRMLNTVHISSNPSGLDLNKVPEGGDEPQAVPLILIGGVRCYLYAMVPKTKPMCLRCNHKDVLNFCHEKLA